MLNGSFNRGLLLQPRINRFILSITVICFRTLDKHPPLWNFLLCFPSRVAFSHRLCQDRRDPTWLDAPGQAGTPSAPLWRMAVIAFDNNLWSLLIENRRAGDRKLGTQLRRYLKIQSWDHSCCQKMNSCQALQAVWPSGRSRLSFYSVLFLCISLPLYLGLIWVYIVPWTWSWKHVQFIHLPLLLHARTSLMSEIIRRNTLRNNCLTSTSDKYTILIVPSRSGVSTLSFSSSEITTLIPTIAMCSWFKRLSAPLFMLSSLPDCTQGE